ncbi:hypothetical protein [Brevibacillus borstelensis]|jgi:hypothetical protein|uniref:hypothetical protein n=1 Tax=Brevibacillus borstelensis TaxID=45462 RepID=UPI0030BF1DEB
MKIAVYYEYFEGQLAPFKYVITFRQSEIDWDKNTIYVPINAPFQRLESEDFNPSSLGISVTLDDMTLHSDKAGKFGIRLAPLKIRAIEGGVDYRDIEQLIIQVADLEELLQMNVFIA